MKRNEALEESLSTLRSMGIEPEVSVGKHYKIVWKHQGKAYLHVISRTSSDHRMMANSRHLLRRTLRTSGLSE
jgi:hypothetical protein